MTYKDFSKNQPLLNTFRSTLVTLHDIGAFEAFLDLASGVSNVSDQMRILHPMEATALDGAFRAGYVGAIKDIFQYFDRLEKLQVPAPKPDFGALKILLENGDITQEEYDNATK